jgi:DNA polymerase-4
LVNKFGKYGQVLWQRSHGIDDREVQVSRVRKSVGVERTFAYDIKAIDEMDGVLKNKLIPELKIRAAKYLTQRKINKLGVKVKFNNFQQTSKAQAYSEINSELFRKLLTAAVSRGNGKAVRLLGIYIGLADESANELQLGLDL